METIIDYFSFGNWIIASKDKVVEFVSKFKLELMVTDKLLLQSSQISFSNEPVTEANYAERDLNKITISAPLKDYQLIEGKSVVKSINLYSNFLSNQTEAYQFTIDIWVPIMEFQFYKNSKLARRFEYTLNIEEQQIDIDEFGKVQDFENKELVLPHPENGYDDFYYPLAFIQHLGINYQDLENLINSTCNIYRINR